MKNGLLFFLLVILNLPLIAQDDFYEYWENGHNLIYYSITGNLDKVKSLVEDSKTDVNYQDSDGTTALLHAAGAKRENIVLYLLEKGAKIDVKSNDGSTALMYAVKNDSYKTAEILILKGADINTQDNYGSTSLHYAVQNDNYKIAEILIRNGADVNTQDNYGSTPLHYAVVFGYYITMDVLLYYDADSSIKDNFGYSPFAYALEFVDDTVTTSMLLKNNADIKALVKDNSTLLHVAAYDGNLNFIKNQYQNFDVNNDFNDNNFTAVDMAVAGGQYETVKWFLDSGFEFRDSINEAYTPLTLAKSSGNKKIKKTIKKMGIKDRVYIYPRRMSVGFDIFYNRKDFFMVPNIGIHDDRYGFSGEVGFMFRGKEKDILYPIGQDAFYQLREDRKAVYFGLSKDFRLFSPSDTDLYLSFFLKVKNFIFWGNYDGMEMKVLREIVSSPGLGIALNAGKWFRLFYEIDYMKMPVYGSSDWFNTAGIKILFNIRNKKTNEKYKYIINY